MEDHQALARWAADCAEHVLPHFEQAEPTDDRPRLAIEAAHAWARGEISVTAARDAAFAAHEAAREVSQPAARSAARAAGHAAATAHVITHASHSASYAAKAATQAGADEIATVEERDWQYRQLPDHLRAKIFPASTR
ncbi:putative immunity protein [Kribbella deserti]|uniref:Immunity protein n=1 Tax=Kribbella deserti TaxID=1926257 RepID=A0ABV6QXP0_9ACTN